MNYVSTEYYTNSVPCTFYVNKILYLVYEINDIYIYTFQGTDAWSPKLGEEIPQAIVLVCGNLGLRFTMSDW